MTTMTTPRASADQEALISLLGEFALEKGEFTLSSGTPAQY